MALKRTKAPIGLADGTLANVLAVAACDVPEIANPLAEIQTLFVARRSRLAPWHARIIAELAFDRRAA